MRLPFMLLWVVLSISLIISSVIIGGIAGAACLVVGIFLAVDFGVKVAPMAAPTQQTEETA